MLRRPLTCLLLAATLISCSSPDKKKDKEAPRFDTLSQAVTMFNETLRWGTPLQALSWIAEDQQASFVEAVRKVKGSRIMECDVEAMQPLPEGNILAFVRWTWTPPDSITAKSALQKQLWKPKGKVWQIHAAAMAEDAEVIFSFGPEELFAAIPQTMNP